MVDITDGDVEPDQESINPCLKFDFLIEHEESEFPVIESGRLLADGKRVALLDLRSRDLDQEFKAGSSADEPETDSFEVEAIARLTDDALSYLEDIRERNPSGNLPLKLELKGRRIQSNISISSLHQADDSLSYGTGEGDIVVFDYDTSISPSNNDMWVLTARGMSTMFYNREMNLQERIEVPGTDWVNDFLSEFTDKEVITVTYEIEGDLPDELEDAWNHLEEAEKKFHSHDDEGAVVKCRDAFQAVKKLDDHFKDNLGEEKWNDAVSSANAVKDLGLHIVDRDEKLHRSDVEMVLNTMRNFVAYAADNHPKK